MESNARGNLDMDRLAALQAPPPAFAPGEPRFWTDPHIARQMLAAHLDPATDAASRRPETIERSVMWLISVLGLGPGNAVLDLGCGPGLYAQRLARRGLRVTGVDFSETSIAYAAQAAGVEGLDITYRCDDYLDLPDTGAYNAALLIYGDLCPLAPEQRARLLARVRRALRPGGRFVLDVTTPHLRQREGLKPGWYAAPAGGFWKPGPHLVLEQGFAYPHDLYLDQYVVVEPGGQISVYRNWFQDYTPDTLRAELAEHGFAMDSVWGDLAGAPLAEGADWLGVIARPA